ncbi:MAG: response regulator [bacterium]
MKKVLVVDDMISCQISLKNLVKVAGYEAVGSAKNGRDAVEMYKSLRPDLVIMDINMPVMDGLSAVEEIMRLDGEARIVMCSTEGDPETIKKCIDAGALDFITKPYTDSEVVSALQNVLETR